MTSTCTAMWEVKGQRGGRERIRQMHNGSLGQPSSIVTVGTWKKRRQRRGVVFRIDSAFSSISLPFVLLLTHSHTLFMTNLPLTVVVLRLNLESSLCSSLALCNTTGGSMARNDPFLSQSKVWGPPWGMGASIHNKAHMCIVGTRVTPCVGEIPQGRVLDATSYVMHTNHGTMLALAFVIYHPNSIHTPECCVRSPLRWCNSAFSIQLMTVVARVDYTLCIWDVRKTRVAEIFKSIVQRCGPCHRPWELMSNHHL